MSNAQARRAVSNLTVRHIVGLGINLIGTVAVARQLGPEAWGVYSIAYVVQVVLQGLLERGSIGYLIQRRAALGPPVVGTATFVQLLLGLAAGSGLILAAGPAADHFDAPPLAMLFAAVAASSLLYAVRAVPLGILERSIAYRRVAAVELLDIGAYTAVALSFLATGAGLASLALAVLARALLSTAAAWVLAGAKPSVGMDRTSLREMARFGIPYATSNALAWLNGAAAPLLVGTYVGTQQLGILQMAYMLIAYPQVLTSILGRVAFPLYAQSARQGMDVRASVQYATRDLLRTVGVATVMIGITSPLWVQLLYGPEWAEMTAIMLIIAPVLAVGTAFTFVAANLNARGHSTTALMPNVAFSLIYWALAVVLVPRAGMYGIPIAYICAVPALMLYPALFRLRVGEIRLAPYLGEFLALSVLVPLVAIWSTTQEMLAVALASVVVVAVLARNLLAIARRVYR